MEILTVTRQALQYRSGLDIEVVVGRPQTKRAHTVELGSYALGMYATEAYLAAMIVSFCPLLITYSNAVKQYSVEALTAIAFLLVWDQALAREAGRTPTANRCR